MAKKNRTAAERGSPVDSAEGAEVEPGGVIDEADLDGGPGAEEGDEIGAATGGPVIHEEVGPMPTMLGGVPHHVRFHDNNTTGVFDHQGVHLEEYDGTHREAVRKMADAGYDWRAARVVNGTPQLQDAVPGQIGLEVDCGKNPHGMAMGIGHVDCGFNPGKKGVAPAQPAEASPSSQ